MEPLLPHSPMRNSSLIFKKKAAINRITNYGPPPIEFKCLLLPEH